MGTRYPIRLFAAVVAASIGGLGGCNLFYPLDDFAGDRPDATSDVGPIPPPLDAPVDIREADSPSRTLPLCTQNCELAACVGGYCVSDLVAEERYTPISSDFVTHPTGAYWTYAETLYQWRLGGQVTSVTTSTPHRASLILNGSSLVAIRDIDDTTVLQELSGGVLVERLKIVEDKPRLIGFPWKDGVAWLSRTISTSQYHVRTWRPGEQESTVAWVVEASHLVGGNGFAAFLRRTGGADYVGVVSESWIRLWERPFTSVVGLMVSGRNILVATKAGIDRIDYETGALPARMIDFSSDTVTRDSFVATDQHVYWVECHPHDASTAQDCTLARGAIGESAAPAATYVTLRHEGSNPRLHGYDKEALWMTLGTNLYRVYRIE